MSRKIFSNITLGTIILLLHGCASSAETPPATETADPDQMGVHEFVRQKYIHGVPYEEASKYEVTDVPVLLEMLEDTREEEHWANIVVVLGIIGGEDVAGILIDFINEAVDGVLSQPHYTAKTSALLSLGYLINRTNSEKALNFLMDSLDPSIWVGRGTTGISPFHNSLEESHRDLSKNAILGLALSGNPDAAAALQEFLDADLVGEMEIFREQVRDVVVESIEVNKQIEEIGLIAYYEVNQP